MMLFAALPFLTLYTILTLVLGWHDGRTGLLPDRFTCPLLWGGLLFYACLLPHALVNAVFGAVLAYCAFAALCWAFRKLFRQEGMGYGDVKYFAALGAWHGWQQLPELATFASVLALAWVGFQVLVSGSSEAIKNPLRFGPFLSVAGFIVGLNRGLFFHFNL